MKERKKGRGKKTEKNSKHKTKKKKKNSKKKQVPAYTAASFAKKFARLALGAPPAGALLCLTFVNNVVRRHPATSALLHRRARARAEEEERVEEEEETDDDGRSDGGGGKRAAAAAAAPRPSSIDPFDPAEPDPALTRAIESSLWEVAHLAERRHSAPRVAAAARAVLNDPGLVPSLAANPKAAARLASAEADPRPAAAATYGSMVAEALAKRVKRAPLVVNGSGGSGRGGGSGRDGSGGGVRGGGGGDESGEGLMLFGGGAWQKGWKSRQSSSGPESDATAAAAAAAALADEA